MSTGMTMGVMGTIRMFEMRKLQERVAELERQLRWTSGYLQGSASAQNAYPWNQQGTLTGQQGCWPGQLIGHSGTTTAGIRWQNTHAHALMSSGHDEGGAA